MNNLAIIIAKRLGLGVLTLFMVSVIIFYAVNLLPGCLLYTSPSPRD